MKKSKFTEEQIAFALHQVQMGVSVEKVCRKVGVSQATFYAWKRKVSIRVTHIDERPHQRPSVSWAIS